MRLVLISPYPPSKGSLNEYAYHLVRYFRQKDEISEVIVLSDELPDGAPYPADDERSGVAPLRVRPAWRFNALDTPLRLRRAVQAWQPDVVLFNIQFASYGDSRIAAALGLLSPWVVRMTGTLTTVLLHNIMETVDLGKAGFGGSPLLERATRFFGEVFTRMVLQADLVAVTIPKYVDILTNKYGADHVVLAPHGAFEQLPHPDLSLPDGPLQIMTFGKFGTYKKVEALIEAFEILQREQSQALVLVIAGTDNPNVAGYLERVRATYSHVPNVRYTGYVEEEDVPRIFGNAAVVVFPYNSTTGSSGVLHQAGGYGKAVVLPNLGDFAELITEEGYTGEFFEPDDPRSMADAIARFLDDAAYRREVGERNFIAASGLPMNEVVDWYLLHFERLQNERAASVQAGSQEANLT